MAEKNRKKVGLALGGGYARGLAHIGILEVLEREGIPVDIISGTSIGALVGALYARERDAALIRKQAMQLDWVSMTALVDFTLPKSGFISGKRVTNMLRRLIGDIQFSDLDIPLSCVATDIMTGDEIILDKGPVIEAVRASISIPLIFTVVKKDSRYLVDGGLVNPVPVSVAKAMGADFVIAVDVTPTRDERAGFLLKNTEVPKPPGIFHVIVQSIYISTYYSARKVSEGADLVIHPKTAHIGPGEFYRARECILEGEIAAVDAVAGIKKHLLAAGIPLKKLPQIK
jgi:NTE family protein